MKALLEAIKDPGNFSKQIEVDMIRSEWVAFKCDKFLPPATKTPEPPSWWKPILVFPGEIFFMFFPQVGDLYLPSGGSLDPI